MYWTVLVLTIFLMIPTRLSAQSGSEQIENVAAFGRLYGYVRYFHPSDAAASTNWSEFLVRGIRKVRSIQGNVELKKQLEDLFTPIAHSIRLSMDKATQFTTDSCRMDCDDVVAWQHRGIQSGYPPYISSRVGRLDSTNRVFSRRLSSRGIGYSFWAEMKDFSYKLSAYTKASGGTAFISLKAWDKYYARVLDEKIQIDSSAAWILRELERKCDSAAAYVAIDILLNKASEVAIDELSIEVFAKNGPRLVILKDDYEANLNMFQARDVDVGYVETAARGSRSLLVRQKNYRTGQLFARYPKRGEAIQKSIGRAILCYVPLSLPSVKETVQFTAHSVTDTFSIADESVRMANLIIAWNLIQHFYPYRDAIAADWHQSLIEALSQTEHDRTPSDFYVTFSKMMTKIGDGHCRVKYKPEYDIGYFPFIAENIDNALVIVQSDDTSRFRLGDEVLSIDGVGIQSILDRKKAMISGSPQWKDFVVTHRYDERSFDGGPFNSTASIVIRRGTEQLEVLCQRDANDVRKARTLRIPARQLIEYLGDSIYYVDICKIPYSMFIDNFEKLNRAKGVIFDARGYPGDDAWSVLAHLIDTPMATEKLYVPEIVYPDYEGLIGIDSSTMWVIREKSPRLTTRSVFLQDQGCISAAELLLSFVEHYKLGTLIGERTAGANGNWNVFDLLGGFNLSFTGMKVVKQNGASHHLVGIPPAVEVKKTRDGAMEMRDEILETGLKMLRNR